MDKDRKAWIYIGATTALFDRDGEKYAWEGKKFSYLEIGIRNSSWKIDLSKTKSKKMIIKNMNVKNVEMNERDKEVMKNGDTDQGYYLMTAKNQKNKSKAQTHV